MKKVIIVFVIVLIITFPSIVNATNTPTPVFNNKIIWNIENVYYYLTDSALNYSDLISAAANNWVYTGYGFNRLYPNVRAYNQINGTVDFYLYDDSYSYVIAYTSFFKRENVTWGTIIEVNPNVEDWLFAEIHINNSVMQTLSDYNKQGTISHEFGHAWGLAHNQSNPNSIMCQYGQGRLVNTVQQVDNNAFNSKY